MQLYTMYDFNHGNLIMQLTHLDRIETLRKNLAESPFQAILISSVQNCRYLSGMANDDPNVVFLIISQNQLFLVTDYRYSEQALKEAQGFEVIVRDRQNVTLGQQLNQILTDIDCQQVAFEQDYISFAMFEDISQALISTKMQGISGWVEQQRIIKDDSEIENIKAAASIADNALAHLAKYMKPGMSERDASLELEFQMQKAGSEGMSFPTILISGERSSLPHGAPSNKKLNAGDLITIDFGAVVNGYRSDMTRAFVVGQPTPEQLAVYETVKQAHAAGMNSVVAGIQGSVPYFKSKQILDASPYAKYQGEGLGHGVGLYLHEQPFLQANCHITLKENMVITIEPGIYIPDWGGVRIEDDIRVTESGYEILTHSPRELIVIE